MEKLNAQQTAELTASVVKNNIQRYVDLINEKIRPPVALSAKDVVIRAMYIISDGINSYGGKFDRADLPEIARLFIDSPVLIGHDKSGLPVARNFWAETVERNGKLWIKSYFYWLKDDGGSEKLTRNIDSGIYKECSVSFTYSYPECSCCGKDIRSCGHQISDDIFFYYRGIEKILETSLVYRGSIPDTTLTNQLSFNRHKSSKAEQEHNRCYTLTPLHYLNGNPCFPEDLEGFKALINKVNFVLVRKAG